jgi:hypothetical protein
MQMYSFLAYFHITGQRKRNFAYLLELSFSHEFEEDLLAGMSHFHRNCDYDFGTILCQPDERID